MHWTQLTHIRNTKKTQKQKPTTKLQLISSLLLYKQLGISSMVAWLWSRSMHCQITSSTILMQTRNRHLIILLSTGPEHARWGLSLSSWQLEGNSRAWVNLVSQKASIVQTSDIIWCNTKFARIKLSHCIFIFFNKFEPGEWVYTGPVSCTSSIFNLPLRALELDLSHLWTTALVTSCGHNTLKEQARFGRELEKRLWQLFSLHTIDPIGNTVSLSPMLHQSGQKQGRRTSLSSKTN